jgi:hypothetical protein
LLVITTTNEDETDDDNRSRRRTIVDGVAGPGVLTEAIADLFEDQGFAVYITAYPGHSAVLAHPPDLDAGDDGSGVGQAIILASTTAAETSKLSGRPSPRQLWSG